MVPMLAPRSYTREDVVELQCHGGDVCVRRVLQICLEAGARLAQPGLLLYLAFISSSPLFCAVKVKAYCANDFLAVCRGIYLAGILEWPSGSCTSRKCATTCGR